MKRAGRSSTRKISFLQQLIVSFTFGIACLSVLSSLAISTLSYQIVRDRWITQGLKTTGNLAEQMTLALLYFSPENAEAPVRSILAFPDVTGVAVYRADHGLLLARGEPAGVPEQWPEQLQLERDTDHQWIFVAPVFAGRSTGPEGSPFGADDSPRELIGFVRLVMDKGTLESMEQGILRINLAVSGGFALTFLVLLMGLTRRLTRPLKALAAIMGRASAGEKNLRAEIRGPKDIVDMEQAFNTMMGVLEQRERQLEAARDAALSAAKANALVSFALNHVRDAAFLVDRQARFHYANDEACRLLGHNREELFRMSLHSVCPDHSPQSWLEWQDSATGGAVRVTETVCNSHTGNRFPAEVTSSSFDYEGQSYKLTLLRDISERKQAEAEIRALNQDLERRVADRTAALEQANQELEAFAYSVSHDLRAPLRHIDGFVALLKRRCGDNLDDQSRRYLETISEAAKRMAGLIEDLLSFSRMGRREMARTRVELNELIQDVLREMEPDIRTRQIRWHIAELPAVTGDRAMLRIVMVNLISNALKFTLPRLLAEIEIGWRGDRDGEDVVFVRDNGVGFDMRYVDKLFGVFQRLHGSTEFEGTGIGLANVRRVISRMGGRTWAEAKVEEGATFYFSLPQADAGHPAAGDS